MCKECFFVAPTKELKKFSKEYEAAETAVIRGELHKRLRSFEKAKNCPNIHEKIKGVITQYIEELEGQGRKPCGRN